MQVSSNVLLHTATGFLCRARVIIIVNVFPNIVLFATRHPDFPSDHST